jgi:ATP-binding cassette subfamily G (WHITE) protein 2 (SNQ2)
MSWWSRRTIIDWQIPYSQITSFWRYWLYYLDPFRYLLGGLLSFAIWNVDVKCSDEEFGKFDPPSGQTCGQYMEGFLSQATGYLDNPVSGGRQLVAYLTFQDATSQCGYCGYSNGSQYLRDLNITKRSDGWRDFAITL